MRIYLAGNLVMIAQTFAAFLIYREIPQSSGAGMADALLKITVICGLVTFVVLLLQLTHESNSFRKRFVILYCVDRIASLTHVSGPATLELRYPAMCTVCSSGKNSSEPDGLAVVATGLCTCTAPLAAA